jgi:hypothetical protein
MGTTKAQLGSVSSDTYEGVRWAGHADWYERDQSGKTKPWPFGAATDGVGASLLDPLVVCPNVEGYQSAMVAWVSYVMDQGADGFFLDILQGRDPCHGEQLGFHKHIIPDDPSNFSKQCSDPSSNQNKAFELLLKRARDAMKRRRPDGFIWGNSGNPLALPTPAYQCPTLPEFQQYIDGDTIEHYICQYNGPNLVQSTTWQGDGTTTWDQLGRKLQPYLEKGRGILALSDIGSPKGRREDAFLCFASSRLAGLIWYGLFGEYSVVDQTVADLYRLDLGKPVTPELVDGASGVNFRVFERGLVAVNWNQTSANALTVQSPPIPATRFYDLFSYSYATVLSQPNVEVPPGGSLSIPAMSGRVYLFGSGTDVGLNRLI